MRWIPLVLLWFAAPLSAQQIVRQQLLHMDGGGSAPAGEDQLELSIYFTIDSQPGCCFEPIDPPLFVVELTPNNPSVHLTATEGPAFDAAREALLNDTIPEVDVILEARFPSRSGGDIWADMGVPFQEVVRIEVAIEPNPFSLLPSNGPIQSVSYDIKSTITVFETVPEPDSVSWIAVVLLCLLRKSQARSNA